MLHISDIEKRLKIYPEPKEIEDIRKNIKESFSKLEFIEDGHKYYLHLENGDTKEMNSVSSVCHMFEPEVDWETILTNKANKLGVDKEDLRREWREKNITSTSNGTLTHLFGEAYMYFFMGQIDKMPDIIKKMQYEDGYLIPYGKKQIAIAKYYEDMLNVKNFYPVMPETQIYIDSANNPYGINIDISGTFDALFAFVTKDGSIKLSLRDWKTNASLENGYNIKNKNTLLRPFNNFIDQAKSVYTIQLSLYQLGIEQTGYEVVDRKLLWLKDDGEYEKVDVPDVREALKSALKEKGA